MADFATFAEAVGQGLGWPDGTALSDYNDNRREATSAQLEESPLATVLLDGARSMSDWTGTASDLLCKLSALAGKRVAASPDWPKSPVRLARELRRIAPQLRFYDISITFEKTRSGRFITVSTSSTPEKLLSQNISMAG
jgi:hypothetical protein